MWQQWINFLAGIWIVISPAFLNGSQLRTSTVISGIIVGVLALWGALTANTARARSMT